MSNGLPHAWDETSDPRSSCKEDGPPESPISNANATMIDRVTSSGGYAFATDGREIENYLPLRILADMGLQPRLVGRDEVPISSTFPGS